MTKATGKPRGRPNGTRKPLNLAFGVRFHVYLTQAQRDKLGRLGTSKWIRAMIDAAECP